MYILAQKTVNGVKIPSWTNGTDAEITEALRKHYIGEIDLTKYWSVGDERTVSLSAMAGIEESETHEATDIQLVIMNVDNGVDAVTNPNYNYQLVTPINGHTRPAFIVGMKNCLYESGKNNPSYWNSGSWNGCARRTWCDTTFRNSIPSTLRDIFKQVGVKTINEYNGSTVVSSSGYFFQVAEREVLDATASGSNPAEWNALAQFDYYKTVTNRNKLMGPTSEHNKGWATWGLRSPDIGTTFGYAGQGWVCIVYGGSGNMQVVPNGLSFHACI